MATSKQYETADIWRVAWSLTLSARGTLLAYLVVTTATLVIADQFPGSATAKVYSSTITLLMGFWLTISMLDFGQLTYDDNYGEFQRDAYAGIRGGLWTYLATVLLLSVIVTVGFYLLIFPAFYLGIRLAPVIGIAMVENRGLRDDFVDAWNTTSGHFWEIAGAMFIPMVWFIIGFGIAEPWIDSAQQMPLPQLALEKLAIAAGTSAIVAMGLSVYGAARHRY